MASVVTLLVVLAVAVFLVVVTSGVTELHPVTAFTVIVMLLALAAAGLSASV